jgi:hypothetical protein
VVLQQEILALKEVISKQKECIDENDSKAALTHQELKESIAIERGKIESLEAEKNEMKRNLLTRQASEDEQAKNLFASVDSLKKELFKAR